jgi:hypothetical protein
MLIKQSFERKREGVGEPNPKKFMKRMKEKLLFDMLAWLLLTFIKVNPKVCNEMNDASRMGCGQRIFVKHFWSLIFEFIEDLGHGLMGFY